MTVAKWAAIILILAIGFLFVRELVPGLLLAGAML